MKRLEGRVAIVTGAGGGIGRDHALLLAEQGAAVVVNDLGTRTGADAASVAAEITAAGGRAIANTDSATWDAAPSIVTAALDAFGGLDILVNNATAARMDDLWRMSREAWDLALDVNLSGYYAMVRAAVPHFARQRSGAIVNTSSGAGLGLPAAVGYASSKEGVVGLTRTVAKELGRFGIRCNAIRPFAAAQSGADFAIANARWARLQGLAMKAEPNFDSSLFPPSRIAQFVVWLCTDKAANVNGRTFHVAGDVIALETEPVPELVAQRAGGWDLDALDAAAATELTGALRNEYLFDDVPELQAFDE